MADVVTMGEAMLRLSPLGYRRLEQADRFEINVGGSELNVRAGDAYTAGFLYGYLSGDIEKGISFGDGMAALQQTVPGDLSWFSLKEVEKHLGRKDFRIQR